MPWWQIVWNLPFLLCGFAAKGIFFQRKGIWKRIPPGTSGGDFPLQNRKKSQISEKKFEKLFEYSDKIVEKYKKICVQIKENF